MNQELNWFIFFILKFKLCGLLLKKGFEKAKKRMNSDTFNDKWHIDKM